MLGPPGARALAEIGWSHPPTAKTYATGASNIMLLSITPREFATILAALRYWQANDRNTASKAPEYDIASDSGEFEPLGNDEIDTLCEQLNVRA